MKDRVFQLLKDLSETPGPVGREESVQGKVEEHFKRIGFTLQQDQIGNLVATLEGTGSHYALISHADEVGFLVSNIDSSGFLQVKWNTTGHLPDLRLLPGQRVSIMTQEGLVPGTFCVKTAHIAGAEGKKKLPSYEEVFLDVGATSKEEIHEMGIHVGTPVIYDTTLTKVGKNVVGKSFDDRVGLTMMILIAEELSKTGKSKRPTVTFVSTVMEELGAKGAAAVAKNLEVDGAIILEVGLADDYPGTSGEAGVSLGKGPVIVIKDSQVHYSHRLNMQLVDTAEKAGIPVQRAVYHNYATDGSQMILQGHLAATIGVPCRYSHSSFETLTLEDVESAIRLVLSFLVDSK
ncbi:MAG: M20/M25/M40 family metallo-hydrolase [Candidatus Thorarchaeota archaeon]|nr:MAG: M20/M25/M40 family metallo-hydrolase [Candidatus Thorarchaeota archaeon]